MENKTSKNNSSNSTDNVQDSQQVKNKKKRISKTFILGVVLLLTAIIAISYITYKSSTRDEDEKSRYDALKNSRNVEDYEDFLEDFPKSRHSREVSARLEQVKVEVKEWESIKNSSNPNDFRAFQNRFNDACFADLVEAKLDSLDWIVAKKENTNRSYKTYLDQHPKGKHKKEIPEEMKLAQQNFIKENNTAFDYENVIYLFFQNLENRNVAAMKQYVAEEMTDFLGRTTLKRDDLEGGMAGILPSKSDSCGIKIDNFSPIEKIDDNYNLKFTIEQFLADNYGGMKYVDYDADCKMNTNLEIVSLQLNKKKEQIIAKAGNKPIRKDDNTALNGKQRTSNVVKKSNKQ